MEFCAVKARKITDLFKVKLDAQISFLAPFWKLN